MKRLLMILLGACFVIGTLLTPTVDAAPFHQETAFTIQADIELQPALTALVAAAFDGAQPVFVEADADLVVAQDAAMLEDFNPDYGYFLPDAALVPITDNETAAEFIRFAISPDGQATLIELGLLPATVTVTDHNGDILEVSQPLRHVITPYSIATFFVYGVGAGDRLVAAGYLGARDETGARIMEQIDPNFPELSAYNFTQSEINIEQVVALEADLVITSTRSSWLDALAEVNIPALLLDVETPERLRDSMLSVGRLLGPHTARQAQAWVDYYDGVFESVVSVTESIEDRPNVLFTGTQPLNVASGEMYQSFVINAAGGLSASQELKGYWNEVNLEQILVWEPDFILVPPYGGATVEAITDSAEWQIIAPAAEGDVYRVPKIVAPWDTPVPDSVLGIMWLAELLYPEQFTFDCATEVAYFYNTFYGYAIADDEISLVCR